MGAELLYMNDVTIAGELRFTNISLEAGELVWAQTASPIYTDAFISLCIGLIEPSSGKYRLAGSKTSNKKQKQLISYFDMAWDSGIKDADTLIKLLGVAYNLQVSSISAEFKRIINDLSLDYVINMDFKSLKPVTKHIVSTVVTLSLPFLVVMVKEPYYGLNKEQADVISLELKRLSKDGSLVLMISETEPPYYSSSFNIIREF